MQKVDTQRGEAAAVAKRLSNESKTSAESVRRAQQRYFDAASARAEAAKTASVNERNARKLDELVEKEAAARREYESIVDAARAFHTSYYNTELPTAMRDGQRALLEFGQSLGKSIAAYIAVVRSLSLSAFAHSRSDLVCFFNIAHSRAMCQNNAWSAASSSFRRVALKVVVCRSQKLIDACSGVAGKSSSSSSFVIVCDDRLTHWCKQIRSTHKQT